MSNPILTKQQAIEAMRAGQKLTHRYFSANEWVTIKNGKILLEDGVTCSEHEFWRWRTNESYNTDWSIYSEN